MESKALSRLEDAVRRLLAQHGQAAARSGQLSAALVKGREELERLKAQNFRYKSERTDTRKRVDAVIRRLDKMMDRPSGQSNEAGD